MGQSPFFNYLPTVNCSILLLIITFIMTILIVNKTGLFYGITCTLYVWCQWIWKIFFHPTPSRSNRLETSPVEPNRTRREIVRFYSHKKKDLKYFDFSNALRIIIIMLRLYYVLDFTAIYYFRGWLYGRANLRASFLRKPMKVYWKKKTHWHNRVPAVQLKSLLYRVNPLAPIWCSV